MWTSLTKVRLTPKRRVRLAIYLITALTMGGLLLVQCA